MTIFQNHPWRLLAGAGHVLEALTLAFFACFGVLKLINGTAQVARNEGLLVGALVLASGALLALARGLGRGRSGGLPITIAWHVIIALSIGGGLWQAERQLAGAALFAWCLVLCYVSFRAIDPPS
ncbi:MAG: hypothetical protein ACRC0L_11480 [Angustibacter sp.]